MHELGIRICLGIGRAAIVVEFCFAKIKILIFRSTQSRELKISMRREICPKINKFTLNSEGVPREKAS